MTSCNDIHKSLRVLIVGGGPAGALCAKGFAENGFENVTLCEAYPKPTSTTSKEYCIVLSPRGQRALQECGIDCKKIPGAVESVTLARHAKKIRVWKHDDSPSVVVSRSNLAGYLLDQAQEAGVDVRYEHRLEEIDFEKKVATLSNAGVDTVSMPYDLFVACDGSNSLTRTLLALDDKTKFSVQTQQDTMEYQVAILSKPFSEICIENENEEASSLPTSTVHSWNHRASNSLCLGFPHDNENGLLLTVIYPGGKLQEMKENDSYDEELTLLLPDISNQARTEIIQQLKQGEPSSGGQCIWPSSLVSLEASVVFVGDSGHGMFPSLGQGCNCALESAAVFTQTITDVSTTITKEEWIKQFAIEYNARRFDDAMAAVTLTFNGMGGTKTRHMKNASILFILQMATFYLLNKLTFGLIPLPAMLRLMFGSDESYATLAKEHLIYERQKLGLFWLAVLLPLGSWLYGKLR